MTTKLEAMVGLLAGRKVESALLEELDDPSSEASRFLEATRARSRALLGGPEGPEGPRRSRPGRAGTIALALLVVAALVASAAALRAVDRRFLLLEGRLEARDREARADARRLEAILGRLAESRPAPDWPPSVEASLKRIEDRVGRAKADPSVEQLREDLAAIRRDLATVDKQAADRAEELQAAIHDAGRVIRLLLNRFDPAPAVPEKPAGHVPARPPAGVDPRRPKP